MDYIKKVAKSWKVLQITILNKKMLNFLNIIKAGIKKTFIRSSNFKVKK